MEKAAAPATVSVSDTPRTDEKTRFVGDYHGDRVPAEFARQLEREGAALLEACEFFAQLEKHHDYTHEGCDVCAWVKYARAAIAKARGAA